MIEDNLQQSCGLKGKPIHTIWLWECCKAFPVVDSENRVEVSMSLGSQLGRTLTSRVPVWSASHCAVTVHLWEQEVQRVFLSSSSVSPATLIWKDHILHFIHIFPWRRSQTSVCHNWSEDSSSYQKRFLYFACIYLLLIKYKSISLI